MIVKDVVIPNPLGLHARAAARLVQTASKYKSKLRIEKDNQSVNGKSILGILLLAAAQGSRLKLVFEGSDEGEASDAVVRLVNEGFGEMSEAGA